MDGEEQVACPLGDPALCPLEETPGIIQEVAAGIGRLGQATLDVRVQLVEAQRRIDKLEERLRLLEMHQSK